MEREIYFYTTAEGKCPVQEFLDSLPKNVFQKISWVLQLVKELQKIPTIYFKKIVNSDDIWECRISFSSNIYRIFCFFHVGNAIVLTHGIIKKSQKTPQKDIAMAEAYMRDYLRRKK